MLSPNFMVDLVVPQRKRSRTGTLLASDATSALRDYAVQMAVPALHGSRLTAAQAVVRPQAHNFAALYGVGAQVAAARTEYVQQLPISKVNYAHTTRIAASGGGCLGPHPARDPV